MPRADRCRQGHGKRPPIVLFATLAALWLTANACAPRSEPRVVAPRTEATSGAGETARASPLSGIELAFTPVAEGLREPLLVTHAGDGTGSLFIVEKGGLVRVVEDGAVRAEPFLDLTRAVSTESERGLLGLAFAPDYFDGSGLFYVDYTDLDGDTVISEFAVEPDDPLRADAGSERIVMRIGQPYSNHNGGMIAFGPDGYLYIGTGDGGSGGDPQGNGQSVATPLGKILRIDPRTRQGDAAYEVPDDNPFVGWHPSGIRAVKTEIWAYGLRNPWRFSFDRDTGDLWIGDVGQDSWEEIDFQQAASEGGENYGWSLWEGTHPYPPGASPGDAQSIAMPLVEYDHGAGSSVTGGYVYRGDRYPALEGVYVYGDYGSGRIWGLRRTAGAMENAELADTGMAIASFGEDTDGELLVVDFAGSVYRIELR